MVNTMGPETSDMETISSQVNDIGQNSEPHNWDCPEFLQFQKTSLNEIVYEEGAPASVCPKGIYKCVVSTMMALQGTKNKLKTICHSCDDPIEIKGISWKGNQSGIRNGFCKKCNASVSVKIFFAGVNTGPSSFALEYEMYQCRFELTKREEYACNMCSHKMFARFIPQIDHDSIETLNCTRCGDSRNVYVENRTYKQHFAKILDAKHTGEKTPTPQQVTRTNPVAGKSEHLLGAQKTRRVNEARTKRSKAQKKQVAPLTQAPAGAVSSSVTTANRFAPLLSTLETTPNLDNITKQVPKAPIQTEQPTRSSKRPASASPPKPTSPTETRTNKRQKKGSILPPLAMQAKAINPTMPKEAIPPIKIINKEIMKDATRAMAIVKNLAKLSQDINVTVFQAPRSKIIFMKPATKEDRLKMIKIVSTHYGDLRIIAPTPREDRNRTTRVVFRNFGPDPADEGPTIEELLEQAIGVRPLKAVEVKGRLIIASFTSTSTYEEIADLAKGKRFYSQILRPERYRERDDRVIQCKKCFAFTHATNSCIGTTLSPTVLKTDSTNTNVEVCTNCSRPGHKATERICPKFAAHLMRKAKLKAMRAQSQQTKQPNRQSRMQIPLQDETHFPSMKCPVDQTLPTIAAPAQQNAWTSNAAPAPVNELMLFAEKLIDAMDRRLSWMAEQSRTQIDAITKAILQK